ncbi:MAG: glutaredoxin family protein [Candidatus Limnocylindrales bacterium]
MPPLLHLVLYTRPGCSLCEEAREAIGLVVTDRAARGLAVPEIIERNIDDDLELHRRLFERIPVVEIGNQRVELIVTVGKVRRLLNEALGDGSAAAAAD